MVLCALLVDEVVSGDDRGEVGDDRGEVGRVEVTGGLRRTGRGEPTHHRRNT